MSEVERSYRVFTTITLSRADLGYIEEGLELLAGAYRRDPEMWTEIIEETNALLERIRSHMKGPFDEVAS